LTESELPRFDAIHRDVGPDAHTASLFPGDPLIDDRAGIAAAIFAAKFNQWRVTLLRGVLLAAKHTVVYAPGPIRLAGPCVWRRVRSKEIPVADWNPGRG
jgi:6-phosphogluconolactonase